MNENERQKWLRSLSEDEAQAVLYDWEFWARSKQLPPEGKWLVWLLRSGRGFGKTRSGAEWVIQRARKGYAPIALIGQTKADVRDTMIELGESSILRVSPPWFRPEYEPSKRRLTWPNGAVAVAYSGDEPDQLRGPQHATAWADELAKFKYPQETWDNLEFGLRLSEDPRIVVTTTPRPIKLIKALMLDPEVRDVVGASSENIGNLPAAYIERVVRKYEGTRLGLQELHGAILEDTPGALWTLKLIEDTRHKGELPTLVRVIIGVDPEATSGEESAETGIIAAGIDAKGEGYVLDDASIRATPSAWATAAIDQFDKWKADKVVAETNQGGEMVEHTLRTVRKTIAYRGVHASRNKQARAEPIASLYEQGHIHHVGVFPDLEDQLCTWVPGRGKSPDRLDAAVWALTELMFKPVAGSVKNPFYS